MATFEDFFPQVQPFVPNCPEPTVEDAIRRAARRFCAETWWLRRNVEFDTLGDPETDTGEYVINDASDLEVVAIKALQLTQTNGSVVPMGPVALGSVYPAFPAGQPTWYQFVPTNTVVLYPTPKAVYAMKATLIAQPTADTTTLPDELLRKWYQGISAGALEWLCRLPNQSWTNPGEANMNGAIFRSAISNAKADVQRSYLPGATRARPRGFVVGGI